MLTTAEVAKRYGVTPARIRQIARVRGVKATLIVAGRYGWTAAAVKKLKPGKAGRPKKPA